jgi:hypothetical protein
MCPVSGENTNPDIWFPNYRRNPAISKEFGRLTRKSDLPRLGFRRFGLLEAAAAFWSGQPSCL